MVGKIIDGKAFAATIRERVTDAVTKIKSDGGATPGLAVILVGEDPASEVYVRSKHKATIAAGMNSFEHKLPADVDQQTVLDLIAQLNADETVHGILCQLPLPKHIDEDLVINAVAVEKDVDGFSIQNVGLLSTGQDALVPATPAGSILLLRDQLGDLSGLDAVVIGRSNIVGKPMAQLLLKDSATVTVAHSRTKNLQELVARADIVVAAVGRAEMVKADWIKPGATVIDVGINRIEVNGEKKLVGDVDFNQVVDVAGAITPVPGGVGPMTIAMLLANTLTAFCRVNNIPVPDGLSV